MAYLDSGKVCVGVRSGSLEKAALFSVHEKNVVMNSSTLKCADRTGLNRVSGWNLSNFDFSSELKLGKDSGLVTELKSTLRHVAAFLWLICRHNLKGQKSICPSSFNGTH